MKIAMIGTLLALKSISAFASECGTVEEDGRKVIGYQCEYQCQPGGPTAKTKLSCAQTWMTPNPHYNEYEAACGGDPDNDNCYTVYATK